MKFELLSIPLLSLGCVLAFAMLIIACIGAMYTGHEIVQLHDQFDMQFLYAIFLILWVFGSALCIQVLSRYVGFDFTLFMTLFALGISGLYVFAV